MGEQARLIRDIDLVEDQKFALAAMLERFQDHRDLGPDAALAVNHQRDQIGAFRTAPGGRDHRAIEPAPGLEDARRIDQQDLCLALDRDAHQPGARGLRLGADDRHLLPDERVGEGRFARIGRADDGDEAAALAHASCSNNALAASVSASCLLAPVALASASLPMLTLTVKRGAWCGPARSTTS